MKHAELAYEHADRAVAHYTRLLAGSLSPRERHTARLALIRAVFQRAEALRAIERAEQVAA